MPWSRDPLPSATSTLNPKHVSLASSEHATTGIRGPGCAESLSRPTGWLRTKHQSGKAFFPKQLVIIVEDKMKLRPNETCPIHRSLSCCGREPLPKTRVLRPGVQRVEDSRHPQGYRELRSPAEMRKLLNRKVVEQNGICPACLEEFTDYKDVVPDHKDPKGMGGAWRDDHRDNVQATHYWCNGEKGSTRMED
jgi:hypothetical protein